MEKKIKRDIKAKKENELIGKKKPRVEEKVESEFYKDELPVDDSEIKVNQKWINRQRTLVVASRGISHQERHLVNDIISLLPHAKKEVKIEKNVAKDELNDICFNHNCKNCLYFEHRKRELVLWMIRSPEGPCAKFQIRNIHTLNEIKLTGNSLKYSRPFLSFDKSFDTLPHMKLLKEMFIHTFNSPRNHPKTKPFYDHILCFYNVNDHIFFRNFQIVNELKEKLTDIDDVDKLQLIEIGPRFSLNLIRIFDGPLGGKTLYQNVNYIAPGLLVRKNADKFKMRKLKEEKEKEALEEQLRNVKDNTYKWLDK
jgi:ribosome biogenesis protein BRX1